MLIICSGFSQNLDGTITVIDNGYNKEENIEDIIDAEINKEGQNDKEKLDNIKKNNKDIEKLNDQDLLAMYNQMNSGNRYDDFLVKY